MKLAAEAAGDIGALALPVFRLDGQIIATDGTATAKQRHGHGLIDQPRRLGGQFVAVEFHQREGIVGIIDRGRQQRVGTLAYQAGVGTVEQDDRTARIGPGEESVDVFSA